METTAIGAVTTAAAQGDAPASSTVARLGVLAVMKRIASFPSRFIARLQLIDELLEQNAERQADALAASMNDTDFSQVQRLRPSALYQNVTPMPGPWGFFASWYAAGLLVVAFLAHRIQNVVVPPRHHPHRHGHRSASSGRGLWSWTQRFFPVDLSSSKHRVVMRIPTLSFLLKNLTLWVVVLLQAANLYPSWEILRGLGERVASTSMDDLCWSTFLATCAALLVGGMNRGLEGITSANAAPFNLFGYAFMLYIYSSPITHVDKVPDRPSRPDKHVLVTIMLPFLQLTLMHALGMNKRWSRQRLLPTGLCTLLNLAHFHYVTFFSRSTYPLLNFVPCVIESLLLAATLATAGLSVLAQLLATGRVQGALLGHAGALRPRADEDFSVALLRLGTASLDATAVAGLGNEVGAIRVGELAVGRVDLGRAGVAALKRAPEGQRGLDNELTRVNARVDQVDMWAATVWYRELAKHGLAWYRVVRGSMRWVRATWKGERPTSGPARDRERSVSVVPSSPVDDDDADADDAYARFLAGDALSDEDSDEDTEFVPRSMSRGVSIAPSDPGPQDITSDFEDDGEKGSETAGLYADHLAQTNGGALVLLAHMTDSAPGPLTRRRYARLAASRARSEPPDAERSWECYLDERRAAAQARRAPANDTDGTPACVICTIEPRQVILWPCRCLALCEDCRSNLATRSSASSHMCPCCRQHVEGYSRIYIP